MTIEIDYIDGGRGVIIRQSDVVTGEEIIQAHDEIYEQHQVVCQQYHIVDKSWCTEYDVSSYELELIAGLDCKMTRLNKNFVMAIIESQSLQYNLTNVWQAYVEETILYSKSFSNQVSALRWIKQSLQMIQYQFTINGEEMTCTSAGYSVSC